MPWERGTDNIKITNCAGCDRRYRELYNGISTVSLWEILAESNTFSFPDYNGMEMTVHDACPTRTETRVHSAIRMLLKKMNIKVVEPKNTGTKATCCGDSFYGAFNPIPIFIPCHRVIGANATLTGYSGGIELKKKLLRMENAKEYGLF